MTLYGIKYWLILYEAAVKPHIYLLVLCWITNINSASHLSDSGIGLESGLFVATLAPGSPAARDCTLTVGDRVLAVSMLTRIITSNYSHLKPRENYRALALAFSALCCLQACSVLKSMNTDTHHVLSQYSAWIVWMSLMIKINMHYENCENAISSKCPKELVNFGSLECKVLH